jgi:hypothetical protein
VELLAVFMYTFWECVGTYGYGCESGTRGT